jgi:hypothetical protein
MKERGKTEDSYLLGRDENFWKKFVVDGAIDEEKLKKRVKSHQVADVQSEIIKRGWCK